MSGWLAEYGGKLIGGLATPAGLFRCGRDRTHQNLSLDCVFSMGRGRRINGDVREKLDEISNDLSTHIHEDNQRNAKRARVRILRFADEILQGELHSKEHFDEILEDITEYNRYCARHPEFPNDKATLSIAHIERVYRARLEKNDFL